MIVRKYLNLLSRASLEINVTDDDKILFEICDDSSVSIELDFEDAKDLRDALSDFLRKIEPLKSHG